MLLTGLTYCGHPLSCAAGVAALESYAAEDLIERSRRAGRHAVRAAAAMQTRHAADRRRARRPRVVRGPRAGARSQQPRAARSLAADARGVCGRCCTTALVRGRLVCGARQPHPARPAAGDRASTISPMRSTLLERLLGELGTVTGNEDRMSFKLTYATMFDPPEELHTSFEAAIARARERLGGRYHLLHRGRRARRQPHFTKTQPGQHAARCSGNSPPPTREDAEAALARRTAAWPVLEAHQHRRARAAPAPRGAADRGARLRHRRGPHAGGRQEPHGGARRGAGGGGFLHALLR